MDRPLEPPRMRRVVTVDRRALPQTLEMPKHPNEVLDEAHDETEAKKIVCSIDRWMEARKELGWIK